MVRVFVFAVFFLMGAAAQAAECPELKTTDTYKELSAILKCHEERLKALEGNPASGRTSQQGVTPAVASDAVWTQGKCLPYERTQAFKVTITVEEAREHLSLCWKDGSVMAQITEIKAAFIEINDPAGYLAKQRDKHVGIYDRCKYNRECFVESPDATVSFRPEMLVAADGRKRARLHIESRPK